MIEFLTLFLGIVAGPQSISVAADAQVAAVEIRLDGELLAMKSERPFDFDLDLGQDIVPHELEAVALAADGSELARTGQRLNVPRPAAEVAIVLEREGGELRGALATWESSAGAEPESMTATLDGNEVTVLEGARIDLSGVDESRPHVLQVTLDFADDASAQAYLVFGGDDVDEISTELTAWPVTPKKASVRAEDMDRWFSSGTERLNVVAVEKELASLIIVRGPEVARTVQRLEGKPQASNQASGGFGPLQARARASTADEQRTALLLPADLRARLVAPRSRAQEGHAVDFELFPTSPEVSSDHGGIYWLLSQEIVLGGPVSPLKVAEAVASAGLRAAASNNRRAVLLVLAAPFEDRSRHAIGAVRTYLAALNVPLVVWQLGEATPASAAWGTAESIGDFRELKRAWRALGKSLDRQRVVWLEGLHLPNSIRLTDTAEAVSLSESS